MELDHKNDPTRTEGTDTGARSPGYGWKIFGLLMVAGILASLATVPYATSLAGEAASEVPVWAFYVGTIIQGVILTAVAAGLGLWLGAKVGLGAWDIRAVLAGENGAGRRIVRSLPLALVLGAVGAVVVQIFGWGIMTVAPGSVPNMEDVEMWAAWEGFLVAIGAGITEETWLRLGAMGVLAWMLTRVAKLVGGGESSGEAPAWAVWASMLGAALLFGAAHLPIAATLGDGLTLAYAANVVIMNAILGVVFGWLYWKRGLVAAMAAHFSTNIILKVVTVLVAPWFS